MAMEIWMMILSLPLWFQIIGALFILFAYAFIGISVGIAHHFLDFYIDKNHMRWYVRVARYFFFPSLIFKGVDKAPTYSCLYSHDAERRRIEHQNIEVALFWPISAVVSVAVSIVALAIYLIVKFIITLVYSIYAGVLLSRKSSKDKLIEKIQFVQLKPGAKRIELQQKLKELQDHEMAIEERLQKLDHEDEALSSDMPHRKPASVLAEEAEKISGTQDVPQHI